MNNKGEKILTRYQVEKLGLSKMSVITTDMLDGYTSIGYNAFRDCKCLTYIEIPNSITIIEHNAFRNCAWLTSIDIPNSVTSICDSAFGFCSHLTSIIIPDSVTSIGNWVFGGCIRLTSVTIPNSVTSIGLGAFYGCNGLTSVTIGDKTYEKQTITNNKCKAYKAFNGDMTCRFFQYEEGKTFKIKGKTELCKCGFHACLNLTDVFSYYSGKLGKDVVVYEVELEGVSDERRGDSKIVAKKIIIGKRIL